MGIKIVFFDNKKITKNIKKYIHLLIFTQLFLKPTSKHCPGVEHVTINVR